MNTDQNLIPQGSRCDNVVENAVEQVFTSEGGHIAPCNDGDSVAVSGEAKLLQELGIHYDGRSYCFLSYRYTRLEDAVAYARLVHARAFLSLPEDRMTSPKHCENAEAASEAELDEMRRLGVEHRNGRYTFGEFKYDKLSDALAYARIKALNQESAAAGDGHQQANCTEPKR